MDEAPNREQLAAEVERLAGLIEQVTEQHLRARDAMIVRTETLEAQRHALEVTLDWYSDLYEYAPIAYMALDASGVIREVNLTGTTMLGVERLRLIGRPMRLHVVPADRRKFLDHMLRCRREPGEIATELELATASRVMPVQLISRRSAIAGDLGLSFRTAVFDLTERHRVESALQLEHKRLTLALAASGAGLYEYTWPAGELRPSPRWSQLVGHGGESPFDGVGLWEWFHARIVAADRPAREAARTRFIAGESPTYAAEFRLHRGSTTVWLRELAQAAERRPGGQARRVVGVLMDISPEKRRIEEAARQTELLRALSAALFRVEENERRELATLLHDVLGQHLVAAKLQLAALAPAGVPRTGLDKIGEILDQAHQAVRSVTFQLRPPILQDLGLVAALRWLARETSAQFGLDIAVVAEAPLPRLVGEPEYLLFRCVRELLLNVVKHAAATAVRVEVGAGADALLVIGVVDDGKGFDLERVTAERMTSRSFGLLSVQERIIAHGGRVHIDSGLGRGTRVELQVPIAES